jgi:nucleoid-associated protein YgaU
MRVIRAGALALAAGLVSGCAGPMFEGTIFEVQPKRDPEVARVANTAQQASLELRRVSDQIDALNRSLEVLDGRMTRLEAQQRSGARSQDDVDALRRDIQLLRAERETLRKDITDDLASRVERIARQQAAPQAARSSAPAVSARAGAGGAAAPAGARGGYEHKVERGQTLSEIARGYGKSVDAIMKANKLSNASTIYVGQVLFIPD